MRSIAVVSSVYGDYDEVQPVPDQSIDADWVLVTDRDVDAPGWRVVIEPRPDVHPRLAAKVAKCLPWQYTDAEVTVWMDTACALLRRDALAQIVAGASESLIAQIKHPWRDCIYDEADASAGMLKYLNRPVHEQVEHYRKHEHPANWGLWATGMIVRNPDRSWSNRRLLEEFGEEWLVEQLRWTYQDQLSEAVLLRRYALRPAELPFPLHGSGVFEWRPHRTDA